MRMGTAVGDRSAVLKEIDLFSSCTKQELARISSLCSTMSAERGEMLTRQGGYGNEFFVVIEGAATVFRNALKIATLGRGSFFGEMALLDGKERTATVVADTDVQLLVLSRTEFRSLARVAPATLEKIMVGLSVRLRQADEWIADESPSAQLRVI
jgi:CRP/FNR family transcriptional regulator, cyclic AMP receptor protein